MTVPVITIDLPWPNKWLSPNSRTHWAKKAGAIKAARHHAFWAAKAAGVSKLQGEALDVQITYMPPDARRRDTDNLVASSKALLDGLSEADGIDDSKFNLAIRRGEIIRDGRVRLQVSAVTP